MREAEVHWLKAAELDLKDTVCREELARLHLQGQRIGEALQILEELAEIEPRNVTYQMDIGLLNGRLSQFDAAEQAFKRARELAPHQPHVYVALVRLYLHTNQKLPEAAKLAGVLVELEPKAANYALLSEDPECL